MNITEIRGQPWSGLLNIFYVCLNCDHVAGQGVALGYQCKNCGGPSGVRAFYNVVIPSLINSIQDFYFLSDQQSAGSNVTKLSLQTSPRTVIPLLFCTLAEVTLEHVLQNIMRKQGLSLTGRKRQLNDHLTGKRRRMKLFPQLTGVSWNDALKDLSAASPINFTETFAFYLKVNKARNRFLHDGVPWAIKPHDPQDCIDQIWPLLKLFVALHNKFVCKAANASTA
jgi:hypothetical protein